MSEIEKLKKQYQEITGERKAPLQGDGDITIKIENGKMEIQIVSIIEDLITDTKYFIEKAKKERDHIRHKMFIRAAILTFNAYVEASINQLYSAILFDQGLGSKAILKKIRKDYFETKCQAIEKKCIGKVSLSKAERSNLRRIRNELVHFKSGHLDLWQKLSFNTFEKLYLKHIDWLKTLKTQLNVKEPNSENLLDTIRLFNAAFGISTTVINEEEL